MKLICKECHLELTKELVELTDISILNENDGVDFLPRQYFFISNGEVFTDSEQKIIVNPKDLINVKNHNDPKRLQGCCAPDGLEGVNKVCKNGHEIGTAKEDCWMPHCFIMDPDLTIIK